MAANSFEIAAFVLSLFGLLYSLTARRRQYHVPKGVMAKLQSQHFVFILMLLCILLSAASSVCGAYLQQIASDRTASWQYLLHSTYFFFHTVLSVGFALYIMNVNGTSIGRSNRFWSLFFLPFSISELMVLTNRFTGAAFYMDEAHIYHRGALMPLLYASGAVYIVMGFVSFFRHKKAISRGDSAAIGVVIVMATLGIVVQALRSDLIVELFFEAMAFQVLLVLLEERSGHIEPVTGALNRQALIDANRRLMQSGQSYGIVLVALTNLDLFSTMLGSKEMDELLMRVSSWLSGVSSEQDLFCYHEERFAIISHDPSGTDTRRLAQTVLARFGRDWRSSGKTLRLDAAVSVVRVPDEVADLIQLEELLSYSIHGESAGSRLVAFDEIAAVRRDRAIETALRRAMEQNLLRVWFQPIWSATEKRTVAAEALLRVDDDMLRGISPEVYIPIAEQTGMIREIGLFVFEEVCRFLRDNERLSPGLEYVELNLSVYQFLYADLVECFEEIRTRYGVDVGKINLEVTETASIRSVSAVNETMERLRALGYSFSLDDFGTGYSNLHRVINGEYANIKIDKSLLWDAEKNSHSAGLLDGLTGVIRRLGYHVVQEGVETLAQLERVTGCGCDLIQGYLFSPPVPEDAFLRYLAAEGTAS